MGGHSGDLGLESGDLGRSGELVEAGGEQVEGGRQVFLSALCRVGCELGGQGGEDDQGF